MQRGLALLSFLLSTALFGQTAQDEYRNAFLSRVEGEVSLQRAAEPEPESGTLNVPILPGDRVWTHAGSRAEIRFGQGMVVRLSEGTKLDFVALDSEPILRLWSGSAIVKVGDSSTSLRIDAPAGSVRPSREGSYRIDVETGGAVTLSVERGSAELVATLGTVVVQSGETSFATPSEPPSIPLGFNTASLDDFDQWSEGLDARSRPRDILVPSLPHEVRSYADDLSDYGDWYQEPDYGSVWYPRVDAGWAPYTYGHWGYTSYGHTWISSEPWGWAPYHYGRWGYGHRGWYWIPGATWGPAWVSFAIGPTWVGWSPLGFHGGPVFSFNSYFGGYGYGGYYGGGYGYHHGGWNVCTRSDFHSGIATPRGYRRLDPADLNTSRSSAVFVDQVSSLDRELNQPAAGARARSFGATAVDRREEALRGFRRRAATTSPSASTFSNPSPSQSGRVAQPADDPSDLPRRSRELLDASRSNARGREAPARSDSSPRTEPERSDRTSHAQPMDGGVSRSFGRPSPAGSPVPAGGVEFSDRARGRMTSPMPSSRPPMSFSRESGVGSVGFSRSRTPETQPEMRTQRAEPRRESGARSMGGTGATSAMSESGRSSRGRSPSMGGASSGARGGGGAPSQSRGSQSTRSGGGARSRSNED